MDGLTLVDPVWKRRALHRFMNGKPVVAQRRLSALQGNPCPFCELAAQANEGPDSVLDDGVPRRLLGRNLHAFTLANRWKALDGDGDLTIASRHVEGLEELEPDELYGFFGELDAQATRRRNPGRGLTELMFVNVGLLSGGSVAHLHGQFVSSTLPLTGGPVRRGSVLEDWELAREHDLVLLDADGARAWVAAAPLFPGELRILTDADSLAASIYPYLGHFSNLAYNLVIHSVIGGSELFAQLLPRRDHGIVYTQFVNTTVVTFDLNQWADQLRDAPREVRTPADGR